MCDCVKKRFVRAALRTIDTRIPRGRKKQTLTLLVSPAIWSPSVWRILHDLAELCCEAGCAGSAEWTDLGRLLPGAMSCIECRHHMTAWIAANPLNAESPRAWILAAHNAVNVRLGHRLWTDAELTAEYRGCDRIMLWIELRACLDGWILGVLGDAVVNVIQRILNDVQ
jgi:hypothetical protein